LDKTQDPDTFFNQLLLINSVEEADALIAANQDHFTRHFIRRVFEAAYQLLEHNPEEVQGMLNVLTYAVNQLAAPLLMGDLLILRADWERRFEQSDRFPWLYAAALDEYRKVPDQAVSEIAVCLFNLGLAFFQRGEFKQAIDFLEQAIHHNLATRQPAMAVKALHLRGRIAHIQGDLAGAQARFNQALAIAEQHNLINDVLGQLNNLGMLHVERGELDTAEECYRQVLERSQAIDYTLGEAMATGNLGIIALERSSLDEADAFFRRAEAMYEALDEPEAQASNLGNLALVTYRARDLEEAQHTARLL
jgi:tetratricopeptide (TPR) repeat protein